MYMGIQNCCYIQRSTYNQLNIHDFPDDRGPVFSVTLFFTVSLDRKNNILLESLFLEIIKGAPQQWFSTTHWLAITWFEKYCWKLKKIADKTNSRCFYTASFFLSIRVKLHPTEFLVFSWILNHVSALIIFLKLFMR